MPFYQSEQQLYQSMQLLFDRLRLQKPNPIDQLALSRMMVRLRFTNPQAEITVNGRMRPVSLHYGTTQHRADLEAEMAADIFHNILIAQLSLKAAIANRHMKVVGPVWKTTSLVDIFEQGKLLYPSVLQDQGLM